MNNTNIKVKIELICGYEDDYNPNYGNNKFTVYSEENQVASIWFSLNEYDNPIYFNDNSEVLEDDIIETRTIETVGVYRHKKLIDTNGVEVEAAFVLDCKNNIVFIAYAYSDTNVNVMIPQKEPGLVNDKEM